MPSLAERLVAVSHALDRASIPHAFGGAIALAYWAEPRATLDIDVNVFVPETDCDRVLDALAPLGIATDRRAARERVARDGQIRLLWERTPVDLFFAYAPFHRRCAERAATVSFSGQPVRVLSAEDLVVRKALFDRPKDWVDIEAILRGQGARFDSQHARCWIDEIAGPDDARARRLGSLLDVPRAS